MAHTRNACVPCYPSGKLHPHRIDGKEIISLRCAISPRFSPIRRLSRDIERRRKKNANEIHMVEMRDDELGW